MKEPSVVYEDEEFDGGYRLPETLDGTFGGVIGDEMGLGKTVQIIAFLAGLGHSGLLDGPALIVGLSSVANDPDSEDEAAFLAAKAAMDDENELGDSSDEEEDDDDDYDVYGGRGSKSRKRKSGKQQRGKGRSKAKRAKSSAPQASVKAHAKVHSLLSKIAKVGHVVITTYAAIRIYADSILPIKWSYCVLDEGHKIRNPDAEATLACKRIKTPHRIILSGTPIQNNLTELWSLYDFVFPGRLGTLPVFLKEFSIPISLGGYSNANNIQVQTAYKCACILRDLISPYLLRRMKTDVATDLPKKSEQVLFCRLTSQQRQEYERYLQSDELGRILEGKRNVLMGVDILRKICNHPDLLEHKAEQRPDDYGAPFKSGKLVVVQALLQMWKRQGHRVLLFSQTRQMLDILETFVRDQGYEHLRMDGSTSVTSRAPLVDRFNETPSIFVFLLTTKVGGLGINLTGADRVLIYDPDWNPSTDTQARERAWRLGQTKSVTIYRLMTSGTIEEKIYHRQIFKQFLTNKILKDPRQRRFFKSNDLHDLFTLGDKDEKTTETGDLFGGSSVVVKSSAKQQRGKNAGRNGADRDGQEEESQRASSSGGTLPQRRVSKYATDGDAELTSIRGVDKVDEYRPAATADNNGDAQDDGTGRAEGGTAKPAPQAKAAEDDFRILKALFSKTGVHAALQHDAIMDASNPEAQIVEREATKVATDAIAALKRSRKRIRALRGGVDTPTWTGRSGSAGAPGSLAAHASASGASSSAASSPAVSGALGSAAGGQLGRLPLSIGSSAASGSLASGGPMSSSLLLANLRERAPEKRASASTADVTSNAAASIVAGSALYSQRPAQEAQDEIDPQSQEGLILQIQDRLSRGGGEATTAQIVSSLRVSLTADTAPVFRKMLKGIADFVKNSAGLGVWRLKDDFK
ncbi:P-loop containing nucleoside triphosphate hydrolase protein [Entophlyctis helioformis]|nr:P-loop containing nucleoside triphosphate hydrolase protein [Entophlyctis helioformis]